MFAAKASEWIVEHGERKPSVPMFLYLAWQGCHSGDNRYVQATALGIARFEAISPNATCHPWDRPQQGQCTLVGVLPSPCYHCRAVGPLRRCPQLAVLGLSSFGALFRAECRCPHQTASRKQSACLPACLPACLRVCLPACLPACLPG
jgi:hypothetical protein